MLNETFSVIFKHRALFSFSRFYSISHLILCVFGDEWTSLGKKKLEKNSTSCQLEGDDLVNDMFSNFFSLANRLDHLSLKGFRFLVNQA